MVVNLECLPDGELAAIVTYLEMTKPPAEPVPPATLQLRRIKPTLDDYRALFRRIGAPWLWFSRLAMADAELETIIGDPQVELFEIAAVEAVVGMLELDFRMTGECEIAFVGLVPSLAGEGHGKWLLGEAVRRAWREGVTRVHVHTCTLDHPAALAAYRRAGFVPYKRAIERYTAPRLIGVLPADAAPQVPLLGTDTSA
ncbi:MAG TPA: GNAT family N-acetyltransferase [Sphingomicrobium sp.]|nr:GNAT family N-acetyltransferase [Sphingomicrobium sp.]